MGLDTVNINDKVLQDIQIISVRASCYYTDADEAAGKCSTYIFVEFLADL